jgi:hypothetical protein
MKSLPIASLALVLALSGCSSSPSIEEQTKLIEYEKCLAFASDASLQSREMVQELIPSSNLEEKLKLSLIYDEDFIPFIEKNLFKKCSTYRP